MRRSSKPTSAKSDGCGIGPISALPGMLRRCGVPGVRLTSQHLGALILDQCRIRHASSLRRTWCTPHFSAFGPISALSGMLRRCGVPTPHFSAFVSWTNAASVPSGVSLGHRRCPACFVAAAYLVYASLLSIWAPYLGPMPHPLRRESTIRGNFFGKHDKERLTTS